MTKAFSEPLAPLTEYPPTPPPGLLPDVPVAPPAALPARTSNTTPGAVVRIELNVRPFGVFSINRSEMFVAVLLEVRSMAAADSVTVTVSATPPTGISKSSLSCFPSWTLTSVFFVVEKPGWLAVTVYMPIGNVEKTYFPWLSVVVVCVRTSAGLVAITSAPGIAAPFSSLTVP